MMDSRKVAVAARQALAKLNVEDELLHNPLLCSKERRISYETARAAMFRALDTLSVNANCVPRQRRQYDILVRCDLQNEVPKSIYDSMGISRRQFYRERREALLKFAGAIERELEGTRPNLPRYATPMVGGEENVSAVLALLRTFRFVTIVGPGGVGKTRTAVEVAERLQHEVKGRVWFVDLSGVDAGGVAAAIAHVLSAGRVGCDASLDRIAAALDGKKHVIVFDNCEHILPAAAETADRLLRSCSSIHFISTSREPLGIIGEARYRMRPLPFPPETEEPSSEAMARYAAVELFVSRAQIVQPDFLLNNDNAATVADIVRRLDGVALAIELAASTITVLSLRQLDRRVDANTNVLSSPNSSSPIRHKSLYALNAWSYDLLPTAERSLLRQLSVFRGQFSLEAIEAVYSDGDHTGGDAFALLSALVEKSLVLVEPKGDERHYRLLRSTRDFAADRLRAIPGAWDNISSRHYAYFATSTFDEASAIGQ